MSVGTLDKPIITSLKDVKSLAKSFDDKQLKLFEEISYIIDDLTDLFNVYMKNKNPLCAKDGKTESFELFSVGHVVATLHYEPALETFSSSVSLMPIVGKVVIKFGQGGKWEKPLALETSHNEEVFNDFLEETKSICELTYEYVPIQKALIQARKKLQQKTLLQLKSRKAEIAKKLGC